MSTPWHKQEVGMQDSKSVCTDLEPLLENVVGAYLDDNLLDIDMQGHGPIEEAVHQINCCVSCTYCSG